MYMPTLNGRILFSQIQIINFSVTVNQERDHALECHMDTKWPWTFLILHPHLYTYPNLGGLQRVPDHPLPPLVPQNEGKKAPIS